MNKVIALIAVGVVIVAVVGLGVVLTNGSEPTNTKQSTDTAQQTADIPASALVLDVRTPEEYAESHAVRATNLSLQDIQAGTLPSVAKDSEIVVYCRSGNRSAQAVMLLKQAGFTNLQDLGGVDAAKAAGLKFTN